jgi:hypothetical protein
LIYAAVILAATTLGAFVGLGGGVIIKPVLDFIGAEPRIQVDFLSCVAVFTMSIVSTCKQIKNKVSAIRNKSVLFCFFSEDTTLTSKTIGNCFCIQITGKAVHQKNRKRYAFRITAEIANKYGNQTTSYPVNDSSERSNGAGRIIGRHKECAKEYATAGNLIQHKLPHIRLRLVPYRAVGVDGGLLLAVPCIVRTGKEKPRKALAAFSPTPVSDGGEYEALIGGDLC